MNTWWLVDYTEPDAASLPPPPADVPQSPTTMEAIREPPKKFSLGVPSDKDPPKKHSLGVPSDKDPPKKNGLGVQSAHLRLSTSSLQVTSSTHSLLSAERGERGSGHKGKPGRSITTSELPHSTTSLTSISRAAAPSGVRYSVPNVPQIMVHKFPGGKRRVTHPDVETVGLEASSKDKRMPQSSTAGRDTPQPPVTPLDSKQDTAL